MTDTELGTVWHRIRRWAADRDIVEQSTPIQQLAKLTEELGELAAALVRMRDLDAKDGIGDCAVDLTISGAQRGMAIEDCVDCAYEEIKDRRGRMVDGVWVKAEDA